jgi:hypothetical protein
VTTAPLIPGSVFGLRTWRVRHDGDGEYLTAVAKDTRWPDGGRWLQASCAERRDHTAPAADCTCGIHAWHPSESSARRVLAGRFEQPGIVEAAGAIELQHDGFRAERARPYAFVVTPGSNAHRAERLASRYGATVARVKDADALLAWCRERGLGLDAATVDDLLGPEHASERLQTRRHQRRRDALRVTAAVAVGAGLIAAGWAFASGPAAGPINGRTGHVTPSKCVKVTLPGSASNRKNTTGPARTQNDC